ncbi:hypothetical protein LCGC14_2903460 [marine sediment metagenome]|uniref:Uncharacterized protein n=1 Tax=marine sediment metagenome TaxID=412755 RepID=A0A0F8XU76_9ZZZZ
MAVGDYSAILTHGWFPEDGLVPGPVEVFIHGWYRGVEVVIITSAPNIITFVANSARGYTFIANSAREYTFEAKSAKTYIFPVDEG